MANNQPITKETNNEIEYIFTGPKKEKDKEQAPT